MPFSKVEVREDQVQAIANALAMLSGVDGVAPEEVALLTAFRGGGGPLAAITPEELAVALPGAELRHFFLRAALLVAHADGSVSDEERGLLRSYSAALGVAELDLLALEFELLRECAAAVATV